MSIRTWREVTPDFYTFTEVGDAIEGTLVVATTIEISGADVMKYTVQNIDEDKQTSFLGGKNLDGLMEQLKIGDVFRLEYIGVKRTRSNRNVKTFKLFRPSNEIAVSEPETSTKRTKKS